MTLENRVVSILSLLRVKMLQWKIIQVEKTLDRDALNNFVRVRLRRRHLPKTTMTYHTKTKSKKARKSRKIYEETKPLEMLRKQS